MSKAASFDSHCARVFIVGGHVAFAEKRYREVQRQLIRARDLDPELSRETIELYRSASEELDDHAGFISYLERCLESAPVLDVVGLLADDIESQQSADAANEFVVEQLLRNPSLGGFVTLLRRLDTQHGSLPAEQLALVRRFSQSLLQRQPTYRCKNCGFSGSTLMWQCPSCRTWGTIKPIIQQGRDEV